MRLHSLEITAFGPFPDTVEVDFDRLSDAGLFLLTGDNGAGKTSILDAVCFALYGQVPGDRQSAKALRCDRAAAGVAPEVRLEVTLRGRRFRVVRSPGWQRPKRRGTGMTQQQPGVTVSERRDGDWQPLATRLDEAGDLLGGLLGLTLGQFCQIALLPQGRFEAFLRASSPERQTLLQQVFRLGRFEQVEEWLRAHRRALGRASAAHRDGVDELLHRLSEVSEQPEPAYDVERDGRLDETLLDWAEARVIAGADACTRAQERATRAAATSASVQQAVADGRELAERQSRHRAARVAMETFDEPAQTRRRDQLAMARRAAPLAPVREAEEEALREEANTRSRFEEARSAAGLSGVETERDLADAERDARDQLARARALTPREAALTRARGRVRTLASAAEPLRERRTQLEAELAELPATLLAAGAAVSEAEEAHSRLPDLRAELATLRGCREAHDQVVVLTRDLEAARELLSSSVAAAHEAREHWLDLREARLSGVAAELAAGLAVGADCPVCGSSEHPHPAATAVVVPSDQDERDALRAKDDAEAERLAREHAVRDLGTQLDLVRSRTGDLAPAALATRLDALEAELSQTAPVAQSLTRLRDSLARGSEQERRARAAAAENSTRLAGAEAALDAARAEVTALAEEIAEAYADLDHDGSDPGTFRDRLQQRVLELADAREAARAHADAARRLRAAASRHEQAITAAGFPDADAARDAFLDDEALQALEATVARHDREQASCAATLSDPDLITAAAAPAPDVAALEADRAQALERERACAADLASAARTRTRLADLRDQLCVALGAWAPARADHELADRVASLVDGSSPDNPLKMRLAGYVVAFRLGQVVDAANERLQRMEPRFSLEHTGQRGAGETRGGLSLRVRDDWSGETRDPATLSGGETFVVSLALALGLADVIAHEAGGTELETLFIDEGFGSLDPTSLDRVLDTLDSLREGRRVVGVVSHVPEMRDRIPTQLRVEKGRAFQGHAAVLHVAASGARRHRAHGLGSPV